MRQVSGRHRPGRTAHPRDERDRATGDRHHPGAGDALRGLLAQKFPTVPPDVISAVVDSLVNQDEPAYQTAMRNLLKSLIVVKAEVQDIEIKGDQATAELTVTTTTGDKPPKREQQTVKFVKENGKWLDCNPPGAGS